MGQHLNAGTLGNMKKLAILLWTAVVATAMSGQLHAGSSGPTVVELFTSQGCYSCPPAEAFLGELVAKDGILPLEFHVDYWDRLVYGAAGKWKDVFSSPAATQRQQRYNLSLRGSARVYTPQIIVGGQSEMVGTRRREVLSSIRKASVDKRSRIDVLIEHKGEGGFTVSLDGAATEPSAVWLLRFIKTKTTEVLAGENKGKTLTSHNIVTELRRLGDWKGQMTTLELSNLALDDNQGCAVIVQSASLGPILGAAVCPAATS